MAEPPEGSVEPSAHTDPVAAVLAAHAESRRLALRTSGTTGSPRWVVRSTASWWTSFDAYGRLSGVGPDAVVWLPGPLSATMNLFAAVQARVVGARVVTEVWPAHVEAISHAVLTPAQLLGLRPRLPEGAHVVVAGDRLSPALAEAASAEGLRVSHYYGASELSFVAWGSHAEDLRPFPGVEVDSRDGILWSRSPFHAEQVPLTDRDGWASVGDRGAVERDGDDVRVVVAGRAEDAVTTAGITVLIEDVESVLAPAATARVAVVGLPHERLGQVIAAVLEDSGDVAALRAAAQRGLVEEARPRVWFAGPATWPTTTKAGTDRRRLARAAGSGALQRLDPRGARPSPATSHHHDH